MKLYRDDLDEIIDILETNNFKNISINTENCLYKHNEIDEIKDSERITGIISYEPLYLHIEFSSNFGKGVSIYANEDSAIAEGIVEKIFNILNKRSRLIYSIFINPLFIYSPYIILFVSVLFFKENAIFIKYPYIMFVAALFLFLLLLGMDSGLLFKKNIIFPKEKRGGKGFFVRNKDQIIVQLITAIITFVLTYFFLRG